MGDKGGGGSDVGKKTERMAEQYYQQTQPLRTALVQNYMDFLGEPSGAGATSAATRTPIYETQRVKNPEWRSGMWDIDPSVPQFINKKVITGWQDVPAPATGTDATETPNPIYDVTRNPVWGAGRGLIEDQYTRARENTLGAMPGGGALTDTLARIEEGRAQSMGDLASQIAQDEYNKLYGLATGAPAQSMSTLSNLAGQQAMAAAQQQAGKYGALGDIGMGAGMLFGGGKD